VGHELILGGLCGNLEVFEIETSSITSTHEFRVGDSINDIIAVDDTHYLLATEEGLLKTTKDQLINHYHKGILVLSLCHVTGSVYLVGLWNEKLIVWNEHTD
jgi:hypothetical protein